MEKHLQAFINDHQLFQPSSRILLAVSGGIDSVVLAHLMKRIDVGFGVAHCNYQLRGEASDRDAFFVRHLAQRLGVDYFETTFDTNAIAQQRRQSIQEVARDLRYEWLERVRQSNNYAYIATAHHLNDSIETVLYNLTKGCGIRGLHGILPKNGLIIRPLLFATKDKINSFAHQNSITFREDASNATDKYSRNKIRHHIIPTLQIINPSLTTTFEKNIQRFKDIEKLTNWAVQFWKKQLIEQKANNSIITINTALFADVPALPTVLFEMLYPYGFNGSQISQMLAVETAGSYFYSSTHQLLIDRQYWYLSNLPTATPTTPLSASIVIQATDIHTENSSIIYLTDNERIKVEIKAKVKTVFERNPNVGYFDADQLQFPWVFRRWQIGDVFQPFGMNGSHKKVSDLFNDAKISRMDKANQWILESQNRIAWVVGMRSDHRFRVHSDTKKVVVMRYINSLSST